MRKPSDIKLRRILELACEDPALSMDELTVLSDKVDPYRIDTRPTT